MNGRAVGIDAHAHVFVRGLPTVPRARYLPDYDALPGRYLELLDDHQIDGAVLVQPSFLGARNAYLLDCLARWPDRFRGVVVLDERRLGDIALLAAAGVVGIRLNLIGRRVPDLRSGEWRRVGAELARRGQHLEVQARAEQWLTLAPALRGWPGAVVIDHLGLPGRSRDADRAVLDLARHDHVWVKVSAPYRSPPGTAAEMLARVVDAVGPARLLWGSDWPWTRHEAGRRYRACLDWLADQLGADMAWIVVAENAVRLLGWTPTQPRRPGQAFVPPSTSSAAPVIMRPAGPAR